MEERRLGHYVLSAKLGQGGMGAVYKARDTRLNREVALKLLPLEHSNDPERKRRFLQEARAASALNHPNIVIIHEIAEDQGRDYIVMEYLPGERLDQKIPSGGLPLEESLQLAEQIAEAVAAAHEAGVVHRDLKPANVIVTPSGTVKVLDFGIAKFRQSDDEKGGETETALQTETGAVMGTLHYMSPEQAAGEAADQRADIFAAGVILYEMLAGVRPFLGAHTGAVMHAICYEDPAPLTRQGLPAAVIELLAAALQKDREQRMQTMREMAVGLRAALQGLQAGDGKGRRARTGSTRIRTVAAGGWGRQRYWAVGAAALVVAAAAWGWMRFGHGESPASVRPAHLVLAEGRKQLDRYDIPGNVDKAIAAFRQTIDANQNYATGHAALAMALARKVTDKAEPELVKAVELHAQKAVQLDPQLSLGWIAKGNYLFAVKDYEGAEKQLREALLMDPGNAEGNRLLGMTLVRRKRFEEGVEAFRQALRTKPEWFEVRITLASALYQMGRYAEAEKEVEGALGVAPDSATGYQNLGAMRHMKGDYEGAARAFQKGLEIRPTPTLYSNLGTIYFFRGMYGQAAMAFQKATELKPDNPLYWGNLGDSYRWSGGDAAETAAAYEQAISLVQKQLEATPADSDLRSRLALYLAKVGRKETALQELARVEGQPGGKSAPLHFRRLVAYEVAGERDKALEALEAALRAKYSMEEIRLDPELGKLREDRRYAGIVNRYGKK